MFVHVAAFLCDFLQIGSFFFGESLPSLPCAFQLPASSGRPEKGIAWMAAELLGKNAEFSSEILRVQKKKPALGFSGFLFEQE